MNKSGKEPHLLPYNPPANLRRGEKKTKTDRCELSDVFLFLFLPLTPVYDVANSLAVIKKGRKKKEKKKKCWF